MCLVLYERMLPSVRLAKSQRVWKLLVGHCFASPEPEPPAPQGNQLLQSSRCSTH